jgi:hypothetical protein
VTWMADRTLERNIHNFWFSKVMKVHEDILESLSSPVSNGISFKCFGFPNVEIHPDLWRMLRRSTVFQGQNVGITSHAKLYQSTRLCVTCYTWLESSSSLVSHPTNGSSFGLPNMELWPD